MRRTSQAGRGSRPHRALTSRSRSRSRGRRCNRPLASAAGAAELPPRRALNIICFCSSLDANQPKLIAIRRWNPLPCVPRPLLVCVGCSAWRPSSPFLPHLRHPAPERGQKWGEEAAWERCEVSSARYGKVQEAKKSAIVATKKAYLNTYDCVLKTHRPQPLRQAPTVKDGEMAIVQGARKREGLALHCQSPNYPA